MIVRYINVHLIIIIIITATDVVSLPSDSDTRDSTRVLKRKANILSKSYDISIQHSQSNVLDEVC